MLGSEARRLLGETREGQKSQSVDESTPEVMVYDVELTSASRRRYRWFPDNAIAHAVESLYVQGCYPVNVESRGAGHRSLDVRCLGLSRTAANRGARADALFGAWVWIVLGAVGMSLHHKHVTSLRHLRSSHAETHTVILPHAAAIQCQRPHRPPLIVLRARLARMKLRAHCLIWAIEARLTSLRQIGKSESERPPPAPPPPPPRPPRPPPGPPTRRRCASSPLLEVRANRAGSDRALLRRRNHGAGRLDQECK